MMAPKILWPWRTLTTLALTLSAVGCATTSTVPVQPEEIISYKTVDEGLLDVTAQGQPFGKEQYTLEKGTDGHWIMSAQVTSARADQPTRDVRLEVGSDFKPLTYSEDQQGSVNQKIFIAFSPEQAEVTVTPAKGTETKKTMAGKFDIFMGDQLFHHGAVLARAYVERNATGPLELKLFAGADVKAIVTERDVSVVQGDAGSLEARHFVVEIPGAYKEHVWLNKSDLKLVRVEISKSVLGLKADVPAAAQLSISGGAKAPAAPAPEAAAPAPASTPAAAPTTGSTGQK